MESWGKQVWFESYDCATFVIRVLQRMHDLGARFDLTVPAPKYDYMTLYSYEPVLVANDTLRDPATRQEIVDFYKNFRPHQSLWETLVSIIHVILNDVYVQDKFYVYFNQQYWRLRLKAPIFDVKFVPVPLPGTSGLGDGKPGPARAQPLRRVAVQFRD